MTTQPEGANEDVAGPPQALSHRKAVFWLALPVLTEQLLIFLVGLFDTYLAGRLSTTATLAIGLSAYVSWLGALMFSLVATGTTALVSRAWGAGEKSSANHFLNQSVPLAAVIGVGVSIGLVGAAPGLAWLQNLEGDSFDIAVRYLRFGTLGMLFSSLSLVGAAALRGVGDTRSPMLILGLVNVLNVILSPLLVFGPGPLPALGIDGIVLGTVAAQAAGGLIMLTALTRGVSGLKIHWQTMRMQRATIFRILRIGLPAAADGALTWTGHFLFVMIIARLAPGELGRAMYAAHFIGINVEALTYLPAVAWGHAAGVLIGQSLGAQQPDRAMKVGHEAVLQCSLLALAASISYYLGADQIYQLMHKDPLVQQVGAQALRFLALFQIPLVWMIIYVYCLRGAGDTQFPMWFSLCGVLGIRVPVAYVCGIVLEGGLIGAWVGMCADVFVRACLAWLRFHSGRWTALKV